MSKSTAPYTSEDAAECKRIEAALDAQQKACCLHIPCDEHKVFVEAKSALEKAGRAITRLESEAMCEYCQRGEHSHDLDGECGTRTDQYCKCAWRANNG